MLNHGIVSTDIWTLCKQYMKITKKWSWNNRSIQKQLDKFNKLARLRIGEDLDVLGHMHSLI